ncbi:MAG TPA: hypothetical protein DCM54_02230 [Gammaproteobacteria bacterium]|nr:hypothetical protein [Gammaproteobacteria bacterium]
MAFEYVNGGDLFPPNQSDEFRSGLITKSRCHYASIHRFCLSALFNYALATVYVFRAMLQLNVIIVGGGVGGLVAALCCARNGYTVRVLEQTEGEDLGAGIQLSPNCTRVLHTLGLASELENQACVPEAVEIRDWQSGHLIASKSLGTSIQRVTGYPYYHMGRRDLMRILRDKVNENPLIEMYWNTRAEGFEQRAGKVLVTSGKKELVGDVLLGADGIHSTIKDKLFGDGGRRFTGHAAWRATVPMQELPSGLVSPVAALWWGPKKHFVHYPIKSGELMNCVGVVEKNGWEEESWVTHGESGELRQDFTGWHKDIETLIDRVDSSDCYKWALYDRDPLSSWSVGQVTLLGDACHPTLPFLAQGAAMAIEDAAVIARCLQDATSIESALKYYETLRIARTARIQAGSRRNGRVFHMSGIVAKMRNLVTSATMADSFDWIYEYDPMSVN